MKRLFQAHPAPRKLAPEEQPQAVHDVMEVKSASEAAGVRIFRGALRAPAASAYRRLNSALAEQVVPMVQEDSGGAAIMLVPRADAVPARKPVRPWLPFSLFALTVITTTWAGALQRGINLMEEPARLAAGLPFSLGLLAILGCHELGHYFTARARGMDVTPPFFIPVPFALGTFGAFISMRSPAENRRNLFDVAVAGPLAGLVIAIPALLIGLRSSTVIPASAAGFDVAGVPIAGNFGASLLFTALSRMSLGDGLARGDLLLLSPLAFAGWLGLLVTALNLLPIGQLDGGHIAHSMFGRRAGVVISRLSMWSLFLSALLFWQGLLLWALIVYLIAGRGAVPLDDVTPLPAGRRRLGWITLGLLVMLLPLPI